MWLYTLNYSTPLETHWRQLCTHNSNVSKKCTRLYRHECCQWIPWEWKCMGNQIEIDFQNSIIKPLACEWLYVKACCSSFEPISSFLHLLPPLLMSFAFSLFMNLLNKKHWATPPQTPHPSQLFLLLFLRPSFRIFNRCLSVYIHP